MTIAAIEALVACTSASIIMMWMDPDHFQVWGLGAVSFGVLFVAAGIYLPLPV